MGGAGYPARRRRPYPGGFRRRRPRARAQPALRQRPVYAPEGRQGRAAANTSMMAEASIRLGAGIARAAPSEASTCRAARRRRGDRARPRHSGAVIVAGGAWSHILLKERRRRLPQLKVLPRSSAPRRSTRASSYRRLRQLRPAQAGQRLHRRLLGREPCPVDAHPALLPAVLRPISRRAQGHEPPASGAHSSMKH